MKSTNGSSLDRKNIGRRAECFRLIMWGGLVLFCAAVAGAQPVQGSGPFNLTIFHTNDSHSNFLPREAVWRDDGKLVGGAVPLAWHLARQRRDAAPDLFVDAGDFMTGNPVCTLVIDGVVGGALPEMMNALGYDVGAIGNHEFDIGRAELKKLVTRFNYPLLAADLLDQDGIPAFRAEPVVFERGDLRIGVIGVSCAGMTGTVTAGRLDGVQMADQLQVIRAQSDRLDPETDLLVLITHNGVETDRELAVRLASAGIGIDVIVGGHSHTRLKHPELVDGILIVQAGSAWRNLGRLDLQVQDDRIVSYDGRLITLWAEGAQADDGLTAIVEKYSQRMAADFGREIGTLATDWNKGRGETNIGNWLADQLRARAGADVGLVNSGTIRKAMRAGPIRAMDIYEMLPFSNTVVTMEWTGAQLEHVIRHNARAQVDHTHGILQVSGLEYEFRAAGDQIQLTEVKVGGQPLRAQAKYTVAMPDYVAMMGSTYLDFELPEMNEVGVTMTQAILDAVEASGPITSRIEGRIRYLMP